MTITAQQIDAGAKALRELQMKSRITRDWEKLPKSDKKKWILAAKTVLEADQQ